MPNGRAPYVRGIQHAFPNGERLVSGPFDTRLQAHAERERIAPLYPDAYLTVVSHSANPLPVRTPRTQPVRDVFDTYDLQHVAERKRAAEDIRAFVVDRLGLQCVVVDWDGEPDVDCETPTLRAMIGLGWHAAAPMPLIHWVAQNGLYLRANLPGAWRETHPHRKATSEPETWPALYEALEIGLLASIDGSAFES